MQDYDSLGRAIGPALGGFLLGINLNYAYLGGIAAGALAFLLFFTHTGGINRW